MAIEDTVADLKARIVQLESDAVRINGIVDVGTDNLLAKVQKSGVSALIWAFYTAGCVAIGAILF